MPKSLEDICCSLDLAKQLKRAGYTQKSLFYWVDHKGKGTDFISRYLDIGLHKEEAGNLEIEFISAPTASEIGEKLPGIIT